MHDELITVIEEKNLVCLKGSDATFARRCQVDHCPGCNSIYLPSKYTIFFDAECCVFQSDIQKCRD